MDTTPTRSDPNAMVPLFADGEKPIKADAVSKMIVQRWVDPTGNDGEWKAIKPQILQRYRLVLDPYSLDYATCLEKLPPGLYKVTAYGRSPTPGVLTSRQIPIDEDPEGEEEEEEEEEENENEEPEPAPAAAAPAAAAERSAVDRLSDLVEKLVLNRGDAAPPPAQQRGDLIEDLIRLQRLTGPREDHVPKAQLDALNEQIRILRDSERSLREQIDNERDRHRRELNQSEDSWRERYRSLDRTMQGDIQKLENENTRLREKVLSLEAGKTKAELRADATEQERKRSERDKAEGFDAVVKGTKDVLEMLGEAAPAGAALLEVIRSKGAQAAAQAAAGAAAAA